MGQLFLMRNPFMKFQTLTKFLNGQTDAHTEAPLTFKVGDCV